MQLDFFDTVGSGVLSTSTYAEFKTRLIASNCTRCELHKGRTQIVPDRGHPRASIMIIGEGPGEHEDLQGKAFVGRAGKLMDELFREVDIDTNRDTLIANVVKCRPPGNRAPKKEEAETCISYLKHQIHLVRPKIILLLGATALKHLIPSKKNFSMQNEAGKMFTVPEYGALLFMVLFHPAYLLYDGRKKAPMRDHLALLRRFLMEKGWFPKTAAAEVTS